MMWQAGKIDRQVIVRTPSISRDEYGEVVETPEQHVLIWAGRNDIDNFDNREVENAHMLIATGRTDWTIRYCNWISEKHELIDPSTKDVFEILAISVVGRNHLQLLRTRRKDNLR